MLGIKNSSADSWPSKMADLGSSGSLKSSFATAYVSGTNIKQIFDVWLELVEGCDYIFKEYGLTSRLILTQAPL